MGAITWSNDYELGLAPMDDTHREFVELVNGMIDCADVDLVAGLDRLIEHTVEHFAQEDRWMRESGFPPEHCHTTEHERVMAVLQDVRNRTLEGDVALGRTLLRELAPWFDNHAQTMDAALAWHIQTTGYRATAGAGTPRREPELVGAHEGCGCSGGGKRSCG